MVPANEGLESDDIAVDAGLGLVVHDEFAALDDDLEIVLQGTMLPEPLDWRHQTRRRPSRA